MSKRFTDTEKWRDPWFRKLRHDFKLAYIFLLDSVDNAGVWQPDFELAEFQIGKDIDWAAFEVAMGDRLEVLEGSGKWSLTRFIKFQFGELNPDCKPHQQIIRLLDYHQIQRVSKGYPKGMDTLKDKDKDKDKDQAKEKDKDNAPAKTDETVESVWKLYPKKKGKQEALPQIVIALRAIGPARLLERVAAYAAAVEKWSDDDKQFVPDPVRWFKRGQYDDDPKTWERRTAGRTEKLEAHLDIF